jgi:hypothetical protein
MDKATSTDIEYSVKIWLLFHEARFALAQSLMYVAYQLTELHSIYSITPFSFLFYMLQSLQQRQALLSVWF